MEIRETSLYFPPKVGEGPQPASTQLTFPRSVTAVVAGVKGYSALFDDEEDHHVGRLMVELSVAVDPSDDTRVIVRGGLGLRDWSNGWDDPYSGIIDVSVLAELVAVSTPVPGDARADLIVTGAETTQAIQHFRSAEHLDAANVFPDNSIRLVADKPTIVRLYHDYDAFSGLARITTLSGELVVRSGGSTTTLAPLESIVPRRDISAERANRRHTLNFVMPEVLCRGSVTLEAKVFDAVDPTQFSRPLEKTLEFEGKPPLPVMAVGIRYTGPDRRADATDADLAAPVESDFVRTFAFTEQIFPIPGVDITSYVEMAYDEETVSDINEEGCDKLGDLRDAVADLRGDSDDVVYGLYNVGVATGSVGGCGGSGTGVGRIDIQETAAHEIGHALGRNHAPCDNVTRCARPSNTDGDYPRYSGYDSDSIGEFGVDPAGPVGAIKNPGTAHDVMGYSPGRWISPYTYKALMSAVPVTSSAGPAEAFSAASAEAFSAAPASARYDGEWIPIKQPVLFVRLDIDREGSATLEHAFHFEARPRPAGSVETSYSVVFLDGDKRPLSSACLYADASGCGCGCDDAAPLRIRQAVAFPEGARTMLLLRCQETVERWPIPDPPNVEVGCERDEAAITVSWEIDGGSDNDRDVEYWSLVQWRDHAGTWRGCAPRTRERTLAIPLSVFRATREVTIRVLVSSGIATGVAACTVSREPQPPRGRHRPRVVLSVAPSAATRTELPASLRAAVVGARAGGAGRIRWFASDGGELASGRTLDLRWLPVGQTLVSARVVGSSDRVRPGSWLIERTQAGRFFLLHGDLRPDDCKRSVPALADSAEPRHRSTTHRHDEKEA